VALTILRVEQRQVAYCTSKLRGMHAGIYAAQAVSNSGAAMFQDNRWRSTPADFPLQTMNTAPKVATAAGTTNFVAFVFS
jgi:hypothetical protein